MKTIKNLITGTITALIFLFVTSTAFAQPGEPIPGLEWLPGVNKKIDKAKINKVSSNTKPIVTEDELKALNTKTGNKATIPAKLKRDTTNSGGSVMAKRRINWKKRAKRECKNMPGGH